MHPPERGKYTPLRMEPCRGIAEHRKAREMQIATPSLRTEFAMTAKGRNALRLSSYYVILSEAEESK